MYLFIVDANPLDIYLISFKISFLISAVIFLYGDSLFGTEDISGYGAPATGYGGKYLNLGLLVNC